MDEEELKEEPTLEFEGSDGKRYKAKASETSALAQAAKAEGVTLKAIPGEEQKPVVTDYWNWNTVKEGVKGIWDDPTGEHGALAYMGLNALSGLGTAAGRVFKGIAQGAGDLGFGLARGIARGVETLARADGHAVSGFLKDWHESYGEIVDFLTPDIFEKRGMYDGIEGAHETMGAINNFAEAVFGLKGMGMAAKGATAAAGLAGKGATAGKLLRGMAAKAPAVGQAAVAAGMGGKGYAEMAEDPEGPGGWRQELAAAAKGGVEAAMFGVLGPFKKMNMALPKPFEQLTKMEVVKRFAGEALKSGLMMGGVAAAKEGAEALATAGTDEHWHQKTAWEVAKTVMTEFAVGSAFHVVNAAGKTGEWLKWRSDRQNGEGALSFRVEQNRKIYAPRLDQQARLALAANEQRAVRPEGTDNVAAILPGNGVRFDDGSVWQLGTDGRATITVADGTILDAQTGAVAGYRARREAAAKGAEEGTPENEGGRAENATLLLDALERGELPTQMADLEGLEITETSYQQGHVLDGEWDQAKAPPVIIWVGNDGTRELETGRSRAAAAAASGAKQIKAHVIREDQGWTREQARALDAVENMREGRGTREEIARGVDALGIRSVEDCDRFGIVPERPVLDAIEIANEGSDALRGAAADGTVGPAWAAECARKLGKKSLGSASERAQATALDMIAGKLPPEETTAAMDALAELAARKPGYTDREAADAIRAGRERAVGSVAVAADSEMVEMPDGSIKSVAEAKAEGAREGQEGAAEAARSETGERDRAAEPEVKKDGTVGCARFPLANARRTRSEDGREILLVEGITGEEMMLPQNREAAVQFLTRLKEMAGDVDVTFAEVSAADAAEALLMAARMKARASRPAEEPNELVQAGQRLVDGLFGQGSGIRVRSGTEAERMEAAEAAMGKNAPVELLKDAEGEVKGYWHRGNKEVVLFEGADAGTLAHEIGWHAVRQWAETNSPDLLLKMNRYAARAPLELKAIIKEAYGDFDGDALMDEIGAGRFERALGERFQKLLAKSPEVRGWWRKVLHALARAWKGLARTVGGNRIDLKKIEKMDPEEAIEALTAQMLEGRRLGEGVAAGEGKRASIAGEGAARNMGIKGAGDAEAMEKAGKDREEIWRKTGWWRGKDGRWRMEIPDVQRKGWHGDPEERHFTGGGEDFYRYKLTELIEDGDFLKAYPQARKIKIEFHKNMPANVGGNFDEATLTIKLPQKYQILTDYAKHGLGEGKAASLNEAGRRTIVHELQHAIQLFETFAKGGNPTEPVRPYQVDMDTGVAISTFAEELGWDVTNERDLPRIAQRMAEAAKRDQGLATQREISTLEKAAKGAGKTPQELAEAANRLIESHYETPVGQYFKLEGEVEARNVRARLGMTAEERAATPPWATEDVPEDRQIIRFSRGQAPNGKRSNLDEKQYAEVRTPEFKRYFGDWERAAKGAAIRSQKTVTVTTRPDGVSAREAYSRLSEGENVHDGRKARFVMSTLGKILRHKGYPAERIVHQLKEIYDNAIPIGFQEERVREGHKKHPNFVGYHNYVGKIADAGKEYYVRITVQEERTRSKTYNPNSVHSTFVSDVELYKESDLQKAVASDRDALSRSTTSVGERERGPITDRILADFLADGKGASKVVDENGEPLVVWHGGPDNSFTEFDPRRIQEKDGVRGFYFAPPKRRDSTAGYYGRGGERAFYLNIRNPLVIGPDVKPTPEQLKTHDGIIRVAAEAWEREFFNWRKDALDTERLEKGDIIEIVAFDPTQVKSATDNIGTFDGGNPDIRFSRGQMSALAKSKVGGWVEGTSADGVRNAIEEKIEKGLPEGEYRFKQPGDRARLVKGAIKFYKRFAQKTVMLSDGRCVYFVPDARTRERGLTNDEAWAEYAIHAVTSSGQKLEGKEYSERVYNATKAQNMWRIENILKAERCKVQDEARDGRYGIEFYGKGVDGKVIRIITRPDESGNIYADLTEVTILGGRKKEELPPRKPLAEVVGAAQYRGGLLTGNAESISQQGGGAQAQIRPSIKKRDEVYEDVLKAVRAGSVRVAAGKSERTEAGFDAGANLYLEREGQAGPSQDGSMTLAYSEALRVYRALAASAHMPKVLEKMPWLAARDRKGRLKLNAAAFGIVDKSDMEAVKESLRKDGMFKHEDAEWRLRNDSEEVRAMEQMSNLALQEKMQRLAEARISGKMSGGGRTAVNILAKEIGRLVCELPATEGAPKSLKDLRALGKGIAKELGDPKGELGKEAREAAKWWREQEAGRTDRTAVKSTEVTESELWAEMFGMFLADPVGLEAHAPKVYEKMVEAIAGNEKLSEAWNALRRTRDAEGPHERVMRDIERQWQANEQAAYKELLAELQKPIGSRWKRMRARLMLEMHSTEGPAVMWVTDAVKDRLAELKRLKKEGKIGEGEYETLAGGARRELEKMRVALLHKQRGGATGRLYALEFAERIMGDVARDGVDMGDLRRYLHAKNVRDGLHQQGKAAALGMDQREADMVLRDLERKLGADGWAKLETAAKRFQALREQHILENEFVQEAFGKELVGYWKMNASYVRSERTWTAEEVAAYEAARKDWMERHPGESDVIGEIEALMDMHVAKGSGTAGSAFLKPLVGSHKAVKDPLAATLENDLRIVEFAQRNHWACQLAECAEALKMDGFAVMEDRGGGGRLRGSERYGSVSFLKDGKRMTLVMPKVVAEGFEHDSKGVSKLVKLNRWASAILTQYSLRFAWRNIIRNRESNNNNIAWMSEGRVVTALGAAGMRPIARWGTFLMEQAAAHLPDRFSRNMLVNLFYGKKTNMYWIAEATRLAKMMQDPRLIRQRAEEADRLAAQGKTAEAQKLMEDVQKCREFMKLPIFAGVRKQIMGESGKTDLDELMRTLGMETNFDGTKLKGMQRVKRWMQRRAETIKRYNDFEEARVKLVALLAAQHEAELARAQGREAPRSKDEITYQVATMSGSPRYENRGRAMNYIEFACGPFMNVGMKGAWRTVESMRYDPRAWWTKAAGRIAGRLATSVLWMGGGYKVLAEMLREAAGDDEEKKKTVDGFERFGRRMAHALANCSDYRLRNYDLVPVGLYGKWSTLAISMPRGDEDRLLMPTVDLLAHGLLGSERAQEAGFTLPTDLNYTGAQAIQNMVLNSGLVPDLTRRGLLMSLFQDAIGPIVGWNPYNSFTQRTVYDKGDFDSRYADPGNMAAKVGKQLWNDIGGQVLMPATTWDEDEGAYEDQGQWAYSFAEEGEAGCMPIGGKTIFQALHSIPFLSAAASGLVTMQNGGNAKIARRLEQYHRDENEPMRAVANRVATEVLEAVRTKGQDWDYSEMLEARVAGLGLPEEDTAIIEAAAFRKVQEVAKKMGSELDPIGKALTKMAAEEKKYRRALRQVEAEGWDGDLE